MRIFIVTMITEFSFEVDTTNAGIRGLSVINRGFGMRRPDGDLHVKIFQR